MLQSFHHLCGPSLDSPVSPGLFCTGEPRTGPSTPGVASPVPSRGDPWAIPCLMQPRIPFASFAVRAHCCLLFNLVFIRIPTSFSPKLSTWVTPSLYWCMGLFLPRCSTLTFSLLNFTRFLSAYFSSLSLPEQTHTSEQLTLTCW